MTQALKQEQERDSTAASTDFQTVSGHSTASNQQVIYSDKPNHVLILHSIKSIKFLHFINSELKINLSNISSDQEYGFKYSPIDNDEQNNKIHQILKNTINFISDEIDADVSKLESPPSARDFKNSETMKRISNTWNDENSEIRQSISALMKDYHSINANNQTSSPADAKSAKKKRPPKTQQFDPSKIDFKTPDPEFKTFTQTMLQTAIQSPETQFIFAFGAGGGGKTHVPIEYWARNLLGTVPLTIFRPKTTTSQKDPPTLPGGEAAKNRQFFKPLNKIFNSILDEQDIENLIKNGYINWADPDFIRGDTFKDRYVIIDEAQNLTVEQATALQSRHGDPSDQNSVTKFIFTGDISENQNDLGFKYPGLLYLLTNFMAAVAKDKTHEFAKTMAFIHFSDADSSARSASAHFRLNALSSENPFDSLELNGQELDNQGQEQTYTSPTDLFLSDAQKERLEKLNHNRALTQALYDQLIANIMQNRYGKQAASLWQKYGPNTDPVVQGVEFVARA